VTTPFAGKEVSMRLMTWNVKRAPFSSIAPIVAGWSPDLLVLPECPRPGPTDIELLGATDSRWRGCLDDRGLGVFAFGAHRFVDGAPRQPDPPGGYGVGDDEDEDRRMRPWVVPVEIGVGAPVNLRFVGVWASNRHKT
jgi:hypothetical protein